MNVIRHCTEVLRDERRVEDADGLRDVVTVWSPICTCGWEGRTVDVRLDAVEDADEHVRSL